MIGAFQNFIDIIGLSNALSILLFLISIFTAFYLYYKTFSRLVYTSSKVCRGCNDSKDWKKDDSEFETRVIFYNNGRKTITKNDVKFLEINSTDKIISFNFIENLRSNRAKICKKKNVIKIDIQHLDSNEYIVISVCHRGNVDVNGQILETGKLLNTEPRYWTMFNLAFSILISVLMLYSLERLNSQNDPITLEFILYKASLLGTYIIIRFIHSILFIPDRVTSKYLNFKDKFAREFRN